MLLTCRRRSNPSLRSGCHYVNAKVRGLRLGSRSFRGFRMRIDDANLACPEEVAYRMDLIDAQQLAKLAEPLAKSKYGQYLLRILAERELEGDAHGDTGRPAP